MTARRQLLLPVEVAPRELKAKLLLGLHAAATGWRVYLGEPGAVQLLARDLEPSVYIEKNINPRRQSLFDGLAARGHELIAWDEEGLAVLDYDWYVTKNIKHAMLGRVGAFLCWGEDEREAIARRYPDCAARLVVTGNPRGDLLRPEWRALLDDDAAVYRQRHGSYILVVSSFSRVNRFLGGTREDFVRNIQKSFDLPVDRLDFLRGSLVHCEQVFEAFKALIPKLATAFPDRTIIVRPHPSERHETWTDLAAGLPNVAVTFEGEATGWIAGADAVLHNGCTTAVECFALGRLPICYRPVISELYDVELPNALSLHADSEDDLLLRLRAELARPRSGDADRPEYISRLLRLQRAMATAGSTPATAHVLELVDRLTVPSVERRGDTAEKLRRAMAEDQRIVARESFVAAAKRTARALMAGRIQIASSAAYKQQKLHGFDEAVVQTFAHRLAVLDPRLAGLQITPVTSQLYRLERESA